MEAQKVFDAHKKKQALEKKYDQNELFKKMKLEWEQL